MLSPTSADAAARPAVPAAQSLHRLATVLIAAVWLVNGLACKVLGLVPRHEAIVARILGAEHAPLLTRIIGVAEIAMAAWIVAGVAARANALLQIALIAAMNALESVLAPDLLLWGRANALFALAFILLIAWNAFRPAAAPAR
jgi:hypothetical protein